MRSVSALILGVLTLGSCISAPKPKPASADASVRVLLAEVCLPYIIDGQRWDDVIAGRRFQNLWVHALEAIDPSPQPAGEVYRTNYPGIKTVTFDAKQQWCSITTSSDVEPAVVLSAIESALRSRPEMWTRMGWDGTRFGWKQAERFCTDDKFAVELLSSNSGTSIHVTDPRHTIESPCRKPASRTGDGG
jgi:hypothetical protein